MSGVTEVRMPATIENIPSIHSIKTSQALGRVIKQLPPFSCQTAKIFNTYLVSLQSQSASRVVTPWESLADLKQKMKKLEALKARQAQDEDKHIKKRLLVIGGIFSVVCAGAAAFGYTNPAPAVLFSVVMGCLMTMANESFAEEESLHREIAFSKTTAHQALDEFKNFFQKQPSRVIFDFKQMLSNKIKTLQSSVSHELRLQVYQAALGEINKWYEFCTAVPPES